MRHARNSGPPTIAPKGKAGYNEGSRCTPTVDGDRLYVVGVSGDLVCLDAASGKVVWKKNFKSDFDGKMMSGWGFSESPLGRGRPRDRDAGRG